MKAPELTNTQALIDRYYTEEKAKKEQALTRASLDIQLDANDLAMLNIIAKRFDKARDELAKDILSNALIDLLTQLEPGERKLIARDADEMGSSMAREIAEENGLKDIDHKPNVWTGHERNIARAEKKRAKELEEARKAAKKAQANADFSEEVAASNESTPQEVTQQQTAEATEASTAEAPAQELDSQEQVQKITESTPAEAEDTSEVA
ncbi:MAG: hypothetical protein ACJAZ6_001816 [Oleispira sp.]|jgi:hypothetical protein